MALKNRVTFFLLTLAVLPALALAQAPVIQISGANFRPLPLAYPTPSAVGQVPRATLTEFDSALSFDLAAAGLFQLLDRKGFTAASSEGFSAAAINFTRWQDVGAEMLAKAQLSMSGDELRGEVRLFNVQAAKENLRADHAVPSRDVRKLAHMLADAIYRQLTHEPPPFNTRLAFVRKTSGGKDVYLSDWDGRNAVAVATGSINLLPAVTPDGTGVAFTSYRKGRPELYVQHPGSAPTALVAAGQMMTGVTFSHDGRKIAYSMADGEGAQIWVANADGGQAHAVTSTQYFINSSPSWSPDGRRLAFVSNRGGSPQIYLMSAEGGDVRRLTFRGNYNQTPDWSPRGEMIAFTARDERNAFDVFTVDVASGKVTRLTQDQGNNEEPTFSPNGRLIIFSSTRRGFSELFVSTLDGATQLALPMDHGDYTTPAWGR